MSTAGNEISFAVVIDVARMNVGRSNLLLGDDVFLPGFGGVFGSFPPSEEVADWRWASFGARCHIRAGIAIDITIRFLVNYKQELPHQQYDMKKTVIETIHGTGISIIYTSLVLIAGFFIFCFSGFGGTQALGWLTSLTLVTATFTNLALLPALLISLVHFRKK